MPRKTPMPRVTTSAEVTPTKITKAKQPNIPDRGFGRRKSTVRGSRGGMSRPITQSRRSKPKPL